MQNLIPKKLTTPEFENWTQDGDTNMSIHFKPANLQICVAPKKKKDRDDKDTPRFCVLQLNGNSEAWDIGLFEYTGELMAFLNSMKG